VIWTWVQNLRLKTTNFQKLLTVKEFSCVQKINNTRENLLFELMYGIRLFLYFIAQACQLFRVRVTVMHHLVFQRFLCNTTKDGAYCHIAILSKYTPTNYFAHDFSHWELTSHDRENSKQI